MGDAVEGKGRRPWASKHPGQEKREAALTRTRAGGVALSAQALTVEFSSRDKVLNLGACAKARLLSIKCEGSRKKKTFSADIQGYTALPSL